MPCYSPLQRAVDNKGNVVFFNKQDWSGNSQMYTVLDTVPCRNCYGCRMRKTMDWALRCSHQLQTSQKGAFITLTYNDENLPGNLSLVKDDFQKFMKRLRKGLSPLKISFFGCGEYGDKTLRPHYHALIFGYDFPDKFLWSTRKGSKYYRSPFLEKKWGLGNCIIGDVNFVTASYVAKYCQKKVTGDAAAEHYLIDKETGEMRTPEFQIQSLKPAIGLDWVKKYMSDVFPSDEIVHEGKKFPVPQYYLDVLEREQPELYEKVKESRADARLFRDTELTGERLAYIENVKLKQMEKRILESEILI